jgi:hypothetical protein
MTTSAGIKGQGCHVATLGKRVFMGFGRFDARSPGKKIEDYRASNA